MARKKGNILVIDDDEDVLLSLRILLKQYFQEVTLENKINKLNSIIENKTFDVILLDMNFRAGINTGNEGIYWMKQILKNDPDAIIILITAYGDIELAVKAIKEGATDFILKPWDNEKLLTSLNTAYNLRQSKKEVKKLKDKQVHLSEDVNKKYKNFIGESKVIKEVLKTIEKVAVTDANVLIMGENGTGKELVARALHRQSKRANDVFISVDMASLSESLFESELFGHVKGSFTDAKEDRAGRFEAASGGTLFLDEIGNLSMPMQAKILTVLQNRKVTRIGSNREIDIDIRLVSATNKPLYDMVAEENFREDLLYRLNTIQIDIPPLRKRLEDVPLLVNFFMDTYSKKYNKTGIKVDKSAISKLQNYNWPGNVRELQHTIEKAVILCEGETIKGDDLFFHPTKKIIKEEADTLNLGEIEKSTIEKAMLKFNGNMTKVAKELGVTRATLYNKIDKYGI
jgi:two-component system response regulator HydG